VKLLPTDRKRRLEQAAAADAAKQAQAAAAHAAAAALAAERLRPLEFGAPQAVVEAFRALQQGLAALAGEPLGAGGSKQKDVPLMLSDLSPRLAHLCRTCRTVALPSSSAAAANAHSLSAPDPLRLCGFDERVTALSTKTRPKQVVLRSGDGARRPYLLKGREDLHQDQRVMQLLAAANRLLLAQPECRARKLGAGLYAVNGRLSVWSLGCLFRQFTC
jgi:FKBP12-rapamycin complex-associated protein